MGCGWRDPFGTGFVAPSLPIRLYLPDLRLPPPDPFLPLSPRNLDGRNKEFLTRATNALSQLPLQSD